VNGSEGLAGLESPEFDGIVSDSTSEGNTITEKCQTGDKCPSKEI
jgi:hypothetical protein